jgi:DNA adenine methylase
MSSIIEASTSPKPFLRWAGGKRKLVPEILKSFPLAFDGMVNRFYEPFVGGGSLMLSLGDPTSNFYVPGNKLHINDVNPDLISVYVTLRDNPVQLINALRKLEDRVNKSDYEKMRSSKPKTELQTAVRFIYLNKTCFNGLWRVNSKGEFNVPWGKIKKPALLDAENFLKVSERLQKAKITNQDFTKAIKTARAGDLVYFDPPYIPLTQTASFSAYAKDGFGLKDQENLAQTIKELTEIGVYVILSNSDTPLTRKIYGKSLNFKTIQVRRSISANSNGRIKVTEIIGSNERKIK